MQTPLGVVMAKPPRRQASASGLVGRADILPLATARLGAAEELRLQSQRFFQVCNGRCSLVLVEQQHADVVLRRGKIRIELQRSFVTDARLLVAFQIRQRIGTVELLPGARGDSGEDHNSGHRYEPAKGVG